MVALDAASPIDKLVLDWNNRPVGRIARAQRDPRTNTVRSLVIALGGEARAELGGAQAELAIPVSFVYGVRRGEVTLDRTLETLLRAQAPPEA